MEKPLSESVSVLYVESDEEMGMPRVRELTTRPAQVIHLDGMHGAAMQSIATGETATTMAGRLGEFLEY